MLNIKWVDHANTAWKWFSMQAMGLGATVQLVWIGLPEDLKSNIDPTWINGLAAFLFLAGMVGRMVKQPVAEDVSGK